MEQSQGRVNVELVQEMTNIHRSLPQRCGISEGYWLVKIG